ncbi:MAG: hypothetical protein PHC61_12015 [Chitinivibrionales bacterium]|nr:hypothetical protein [Chitinivibrionales bacterium]
MFIKYANVVSLLFLMVLLWSGGASPPAATAPSVLSPAPNSYLTYTINEDTVAVTVVMPGLHRLEIVRSDGSVAARLGNDHAVSYALSRKLVPAGIYMLRATNSANQRVAKLITWY